MKTKQQLLHKYLLATSQPNSFWELFGSFRHGKKYIRKMGKRLQVLGLATVLLGLSSPAQAQVVRAFTPRFSTNNKGDIQIVGNTLSTCPIATAGCTDAQAGIGSGITLNNNNFNMVRVDVDADSTTFNSSSATFNLPPGATVLWAGLYWGGDVTNGGTGGVAAPNPAQRGTVKFATPATGGYTDITAITTNTNTSSGDDYQSLAVVTSLVQAGGSGTYTVANVQTGTGVDRQGGWSLVVVYSDSTQPARNLTVFDGYAVVNTTTPSVSFPVSGFIAPPSGQVNAKIGAVAYEGDRGSTGDNLKFNGTNLINGLNPTDNFFNSSITRTNNNVINKNPNYVNQLGFDIDVLDLVNPSNTVLGNSATSATINLTTSTAVGEFYQPGVITTAIDLFVPVIVLDKTFIDVNGGNVEPGDILEYTIAVTNNRDANGNGDPANNNLLTDPIPTNTTYVPNSLVIDGTSKTDGTTDDQAEFDSANNRTVFRLGAAATATQGGTLSVNTNSSPTPPSAGSSSTVKFRVRINANVPDGTLIVNEAKETFTGQTLGQGSTLDAATPTVAVRTENPSVRGTLYRDTDGGNDFDSGEPGLPADITVTLYQDIDNDNIIDSGEQVATTTTDANGNYTFLDIPNQTYKIQVDTTDPQIPTNYILGTPNNLAVTVAGLPIAGQNFGFDVSSVPPNLLLVKRITAINGVDVTGFIDGINTPGDPNDVGTKATEDNDPFWPTPNTDSLRGAIHSSTIASGASFKPGDEVEYTIYFLNNGASQATNVSICDFVPANQTYISTGYSSSSLSNDAGGLAGSNYGIAIQDASGATPLKATNAVDGDRGQFYNSGFPTSCTGTNSGRGAVVVNMGTVPNATGAGTPANSYGFIRFKAKID